MKENIWRNPEFQEKANAQRRMWDMDEFTEEEFEGMAKAEERRREANAQQMAWSKALNKGNK